ncbi:hypothetical protein ACHFJ0_05025 [Paracoccus sp. NGMCC 1.201697]|uniref:Uncharacterized protein n=1 Tax=Paracoccus broussonetiae subsp. drimophilus TaxID=3373869 RepID=A0ABW7LIQ0_9RHOB
MHKALQALIAVTCLVVIACGGWWLYDRNQLRELQNRAVERQQILAKARQDALAAGGEKRRKYEIESCRYDLAEREKGNMLLFVERAKNGDIMAEVRKCEALVNSSKPSE